MARVVARSTFGALRKPAGKARNGPILAIFTPLPTSDGRPQVAYAVSKRCGGAVDRNLIRRRLRAASEREADQIPPGAYLIRTDPQVIDLVFDELTRSLIEAMSRAAERSKEPRNGA